MKTRFSLLTTATILMFSLPACAASSDVDLLSYDEISKAPVITQSDAPPVELTPPVVTETPAPAPAPKPRPPAAKPKPKKVAPVAPKVTEVKKPEAAPIAKPAPVQPPLLKAGDVIRMDVKDEAELSGSYTIAPDGSLPLPLLGNKPAAGMTLLDLKTAITAAYKDGYLIDPKVSISKEVAH